MDKTKTKQKSKAQKITKETLIGEVVEKYPQTIETLMGLGLHCIGCHVSAFESIEMGFKAHGMDNKQIEEAVKMLNDVISQNSKIKKK